MEQGDDMGESKTARDWARLHVRWYRDPVIRAIAVEHPTVIALWPVLVAMAKDESHHVENPEGVIEITVPDLARFVCASDDEVRRTLNELVEGELLITSEIRFGIVQIRLAGFLIWQAAKGSAKERSQVYREVTSRQKAKLRHGSVTAPNVSEAQTETETETETEKKKPISSLEAADKSQPPGAARDDARILFDYWLKHTGRNANANRLTQQRRSRVNARRRDGYTMQQLEAAIRGIAGSPWHTGDNPGGKRYDTFDYIMRGSETVERGIEYDAASANRTAAKTSPNATDYDATRRHLLDQGIDPERVENMICKMQERDNGQRTGQP